jgi:hypothetical protein
MLFNRLIVTAAAVLAIAAPAMGAPAAQGSPRAFVAWIYSHYPAPEHSAFDPMGRSAAQVFDPPMVALLREDSRLAGGEVGAIDADLFCQCQDDAGLKAHVDDVRTTGPAAASAVVALAYPGDAQAGPPSRITLSLVLLNGRWRVHDIASADTPSLRSMLIHANAEARRGRR